MANVTSVETEVEDAELVEFDVDIEDGVDVIPEDDVPSTDVNAEEEVEPEPIVLADLDTDDTALERSIFSPTGLVLSDDVDLDTWLRLGANLDRIRTGHQWWTGDWYVYGEEKFQEESAQGLSAFGNGEDPKTVSNYRWVSKQCPPDIRVASLSWTHHRIAAELDTKRARKAALVKAEKEGWSSRDLSLYVKSKKAKAPKDGSETTEKAPKANITFSLSITVSKDYERILTAIMGELEESARAALTENEVQDPRVTNTTA